MYGQESQTGTAVAQATQGYKSYLDNYRKLKKSDGDKKQLNKHSYKPSETQWKKSNALKMTLKTTVIKENFGDDTLLHHFDKPLNEAPTEVHVGKKQFQKTKSQDRVKQKGNVQYKNQSQLGQVNMGGRDMAQSIVSANKSEVNLASGQKSEIDYRRESVAYLTQNYMQKTENVPGRERNSYIQSPDSRANSMLSQSKSPIPHFQAGFKEAQP